MGVFAVALLSTLLALEAVAMGSDLQELERTGPDLSTARGEYWCADPYALTSKGLPHFMQYKRRERRYHCCLARHAYGSPKAASSAGCVTRLSIFGVCGSQVFSAKNVKK